MTPIVQMKVRARERHLGLKNLANPILSAAFLHGNAAEKLDARAAFFAHVGLLHKPLFRIPRRF
jgi:hypothetical protein